ncbi:MAG: hypothetical protein JO277_09710 [Candidatus Eremiobacteraeota bacterium]|nr:hypothetical protein [Candidatus Eremiobacteraeota bacterium]
MTRLGACAACGHDVVLVYFDAVNGCRACIGCGRRGPEALLTTEVLTVADSLDDQTIVDWQPEVEFAETEEPTRIGPPPAELLAQVKGPLP